MKQVGKAHDNNNNNNYNQYIVLHTRFSILNVLIMTGVRQTNGSVKVFEMRFSKFEHHWPMAIYIIFHGSIDEVHN